jgi:hypothetical protein
VRDLNLIKEIIMVDNTMPEEMTEEMTGLWQKIQARYEQELSTGGWGAGLWGRDDMEVDYATGLEGYVAATFDDACERSEKLSPDQQTKFGSFLKVAKEAYKSYARGFGAQIDKIPGAQTTKNVFKTFMQGIIKIGEFLSLLINSINPMRNRSGFADNAQEAVKEALEVAEGVLAGLEDEMLDTNTGDLQAEVSDEAKDEFAKTKRPREWREDIVEPMSTLETIDALKAKEEERVDKGLVELEDQEQEDQKQKDQEVEMATRLQALARKVAAKSTVEKLREEAKEQADMATKIQGLARKVAAKSTVGEKRRQEASATTIQSAFRRNKAERDLEELRASMKTVPAPKRSKKRKKARAAETPEEIVKGLDSFVDQEPPKRDNSVGGKRHKKPPQKSPAQGAKHKKLRQTRGGHSDKHRPKAR